ncbi:MAG: hypothetical protein RIS88_2123 [Pseudomonadota bacterium]|jgi:predicted Zn finger-like uncharacterized protein
MSLIARCPACATLFRVVPDQLKISDGWVRCGQCAEVFDAHLTLQEAPAPAVPVQGPATDSVGDDFDSSQDSRAPHPDGRPEPEAEAEAEAEPEGEPAHEAMAVQSPAEPVLEPGPLAGDALETSPALGAAIVDAALEPPPVAEPQADASPLRDMAFVRQARRRAFWNRRGVRMAMGVAAIGLGLLLAGQVGFHHRDRLAAQLPVLRPVLAALCVSPQCRLGPPRRIESIAIESSAFTRVRADAFRLNLTLSNQADIALAVPALELTLTDLQDQPVLRRVLQPSDLGPQVPQSIEAGAEWTSTLTLAIAPGANPARIVGYRVLAFYP